MKYSSTILILVWILYSNFALILSDRSTREADEEAWIKVHGTHKKYSGCWPLARYFRNHLDELKVFCARAHERWTNESTTTLEAYVNHWLITFDDSRRRPIWADLIMYAEERERPQPQILIYHFFVKGNRPDCVFYMSQIRRTREAEIAEMVFTEHVCGVTGFEEFAPNANKCDVQARSEIPHG